MTYVRSISTYVSCVSFDLDGKITRLAPACVLQHLIAQAESKKGRNKLNYNESMHTIIKRYYTCQGNPEDVRTEIFYWSKTKD